MNTDPEVNGEQESKEGMNGLSMEQLMENSLQSLKEGEVVHGTVVAVTGEEVLVDIGAAPSTVRLREGDRLDRDRHQELPVE